MSCSFAFRKTVMGICISLTQHPCRHDIKQSLKNPSEELSELLIPVSRKERAWLPILRKPTASITPLGWLCSRASGAMRHAHTFHLRASFSPPVPTPAQSSLYGLLPSSPNHLSGCSQVKLSKKIQFAKCYVSKVPPQHLHLDLPFVFCPLLCTAPLLLLRSPHTSGDTSLCKQSPSHLLLMWSGGALRK